MEKEFNIKLESKDIKIILKGFPDLLIKSGDKRVSIVDYKTGSAPKISPEEGKGIQLFIYFYLYNKTHGDNNTLFGVFYKKIEKSIKTDSDPIKVSGVYMGEEDEMENFSSSTIFYPKRSGKIDIETMQKYLDSTEKIVFDTIDNSLSLKFPIQPTDKDACMFCSFKEICYKNEGINLEIDESSEGEK